MTQRQEFGLLIMAWNPHFSLMSFMCNLGIRYIFMMILVFFSACVCVYFFTFILCLYVSIKNRNLQYFYKEW